MLIIATMVAGYNENNTFYAKKLPQHLYLAIFWLHYISVSLELRFLTITRPLLDFVGFVWFYLYLLLVRLT